MEPREWIAQGIGLVAMLFNILSYQGKTPRAVITLQMIGSALFSVNFLMLGATVGALLNVIAALRALVFFYKEKLKADRPVWFFAFSAIYVAVYILNFTLFGGEPTAVHLLVELLPVIAMMAIHIGYNCKKAADIRKWGLVSSPSWLIYNIVVGSWGAILCEVFTLFSIFIGIWRLDRRKKDRTETGTAK